MAVLTAYANLEICRSRRVGFLKPHEQIRSLMDDRCDC